MFRSIPFPALLLTACLVLLAGCSDSGPGPEEVAKQAFEATVSADMAAARPLYCEAMQSLFPSQEEIDALQKELGVEFEFDFSQLSYALQESTDDTATVAVTGKLQVTTPAGPELIDYNEQIHLIRENGGWLVCE